MSSDKDLHAVIVWPPPPPPGRYDWLRPHTILRYPGAHWIVSILVQVRKL